MIEIYCFKQRVELDQSYIMVLKLILQMFLKNMHIYFYVTFLVWDRLYTHSCVTGVRRCTMRGAW